MGTRTITDNAPGLSGNSTGSTNRNPSKETISPEVTSVLGNVGRPALIGATVEKPLDASLWRMVTGEICLHDLTPALAGFYSVGFEDGRQSLAHELAKAENERDTFYERWANPGKELTEVRLRRAREAAEDYWDEFVADAHRQGEAQ